MNKDIQDMIEKIRNNIIRPEKMGNPGDASEIVVDMYLNKAFKELEGKDTAELEKLEKEIEANLLEMIPLKMDSVFLIMYMKCQLFAINMVLEDDE